MRELSKYICAVVLFCLAFWGITYTADWAGYEYAFNNDTSIKNDYALLLIINILKSHGIFEFRVAYRVHIALMSFLFPLVFIKLKKNPIPLTILFVVLTYVPLANQIRFYVAFPLAILSFLYFTNRKYVTSAVLCVLSVGFHSIILILLFLLIFYYCYIRKNDNSRRNYLYFSIGIVFILLVSPLLSYMPEDFYESYVAYSESGAISSFIGGLYTLIPILFILVIVFSVDRKARHIMPNFISKHNTMYYSLKTLSVATAILIPLGFKMQIFVNRFISPLLVFQIIFLLYIQKYSAKENKRINTSGWVVAIILVEILWQTLVPYLMHLSSSPINPELLLTLRSYQL